jgi:putative phosphoesterase
MRIAVISDIHGNLAALEAVLADIARIGADVTANLGDILSGPLEPALTADRLMELDLPTIAGNHERQVLTFSDDRINPTDVFTKNALSEQQLDWLRSLPATLSLSDDVFLCHGTPANDLDCFIEDVTPEGLRRSDASSVEMKAGDIEAELILCGHTHLPGIVLLPDGRTVANPGSVGLQAYRHNVPFPLLVENGSPHARYMLAERQNGRWSFRQMYVEYDWDAAAALALKNGAGDWAVALATGRMAS